VGIEMILEDDWERNGCKSVEFIWPQKCRVGRSGKWEVGSEK
jgi:hypothetical protein